MFHLFVFFLLIFGQFCDGSLINKIDNGCEPPPMPTYLPDNGAGSYCRFNARYSTLDFVFLIDGTNGTFESVLQRVQTILFNSLKLDGALYSNSTTTNNAAFLYVANRTIVAANFGTLNSADEVADQFMKIIQYRNELNSSALNLTLGLQFIHENIFDYSNGRPKLLTVITDFFNAEESHNQEFANTLKTKGVKIFSIPFSQDDFVIENSYISKISSPGWYFKLVLDSLNSTTSSALFTAFSNFARQTNCVCPENTKQFSAISSAGTMQIYADCLQNINETTDEKITLAQAEMQCISDINLNSRIVALNTSIKFNFVKNLLSGYNDTFWSGKNGTSWIPYSGTTLPVDYLPESIYDPQIQAFCRLNFNITNGTGAAIVPFNDTFVLCNASSTNLIRPFCEFRAMDAFDSEMLCKSPFINSDVRPNQIGSPCSNNLFNSYLDVIVIVDSSKLNSLHQLDIASKILSESFKKINFDFKSDFSTRLGLISFSTFPRIIASFGEITTVQQMEKIFDLKKYSNVFDKNRNAVLAFKQAQTMLMLKKTFRKPVIVFVSSGISNSSDPYDISQLLKSLLNVRIITISTATTTEDKIDRIASLGMNIATINNEKAAEESFEKNLAFANCYCKSGWIQFIDSSDNQTSYYGDCLRGFSNAETPASAFNICKNFGGVPISLTSAEKSKFVSTSIIYEQINKSPIYTIGLKRHSTNINLKTWTHFSGEDFSIGEFPTHLSQVSNDDLSLNCTMALQIGHQTFFSPIGCSSSKLPFICQIPAFDGNRQEIKN